MGSKQQKCFDLFIQNDKKGQTNMKNQHITMPALALRGLVIFPGMILHFDIARDRSINAVEEAIEHNDRRIFLVTQIDEDVDEVAAENLYKTGVVAEIRQTLNTPDGARRVLVQGLYTAKLCGISQDDPFLVSDIVPMPALSDTLSAAEKTAFIRTIHTEFKQLLEYILYIAYNGYRCGKVLAYFRRVNIYMYYRCTLKSAYCGDRSVAYSRTEKYQQVAVVDSVVRTLYAVHTYHSVEQGIVRRNTAHTHHCVDNRYIRHLHELSQQIYRTCGKDTSARTDKRLFALFYGGNGTLYLQLVSLNAGLIRAYIHRFRIFKIYYCLLNVKRHIYKHRSRSAGACDVKCVFEDDRHFRRVFDKIAVLYERLSCSFVRDSNGTLNDVEEKPMDLISSFSSVIFHIFLSGCICTV
jgi:Lon protease-like protein